MGQKLGPLKISRNYSISSKIADRLKDYAQKVGIWRSRVVEIALTEYMDKMEAQKLEDQRSETRKAA